MKIYGCSTPISRKDSVLDGVSVKLIDGKVMFMKKLQFVKSKLKEWNKVSFGNLKKKKKVFIQTLLPLMLVSRKGI